MCSGSTSYKAKNCGISGTEIGFQRRLEADQGLWEGILEIRFMMLNEKISAKILYTEKIMLVFLN